MSLNNVISLTPELIEAVEKTAVYNIDPSDYPTYLAQWRVYECKIKGRTEPARHLNGRTIDSFEGRVSSAVQSWEITDKGIKCVTKSGNVYILVGHPGSNVNAEYVFNRWKDINSAEDLIDVTDEYYDHEQSKQILPA